jgi:hypothetical protein
MAFIDELDRVHDEIGIAHVVLNETETDLPRFAARWAKARAIPRSMLAHSLNLNRYYTATTGIEAERLFVFGPRGIESFVDAGISRAQCTVTGSPAWDALPALVVDYPTRREQMRSQFQAAPGDVVAMFATTWFGKLAAGSEPDIFERSATAFLTACRTLQLAGLPIVPLVKGRPANEHEQRRIAEIANATGTERCVFFTGDINTALCAADVLVGCNTGAFVEAAILRVPSIDLVTRTAWLLGPAYGVDDGIATVSIADPVAIAERMRTIVERPEVRDDLLRRAQQRLPELTLPPDGRAAERVARELVAHLGSPLSAWEMFGRTGRGGDVADDVANAMAAQCGTPSGSMLLIGTAADRLRTRSFEARFAPLSVRAARGRDDLSALAQAGQRFETIVLAHALEEAENPLLLLRDVRSIAAPGARIVLAVANARNLWFIDDFARGTWVYGRGGSADIARKRFFTKALLLDVVRDAAFELVALVALTDPRGAGIASPPAGATFDITTPRLVHRALSGDDLAELRASTFVAVVQ